MEQADRAKQAHDCRQWVTSELGKPREQHQQYSKWLCPFHADRRTPSFTVWTDHYHCFGCGVRGDIIDWVKARRGMTTMEAIRFLLNEQPTLSEQLRKQEAQARSRAADERRLAQEHLARARWWEQYADDLALHREAIEYLEGRGIPEAVAYYFHLGYRDSPWGPAVSIPWTVGTEPRGIQYRIIGGDGDLRYRWDERAHGRPTIYNADVIQAGSKPLWIVEGAFKALVLITHGLESVALVNKQGWKTGWAKHFRHRPVFVCLDPDAEEQAGEVAADIGPTSKVVHLPRKPDDLIVEYGWPAQAMERFARVGRLQ